MNKFYIITNKYKDQDQSLTASIVSYLEERDCRCLVCQGEEKREGDYHYTDPSRIPRGTQCIMVLGGDGTLLQAARDVVHLGIPLLGINLGTLGYLAEVDRHSIYPALDQLMRGDYELEERMMLEGIVYRGEEVIGRDLALNDIVIGREGPIRVVRFNNFVNDEYLNSYNADGIILSTPTGSTGYSLSVGGPIVSPSGSMLIMTAIAPHTLNSRSIVFPASDVITVEMGEGRHRDCERGLAVFDGDTAIHMVTGDRIVVRRAGVKTKIVKLNHLSFVEVLRCKMRDT
ncbi:MAG: NAD(+)/NADH kinase [Eubacteriales bacterium]|nr:NAD(+)/NADH kinase [Eubacteriales bacterium]